ncbi:aldo/keto reductase [Chloroflexota bacterium]
MSDYTNSVLNPEGGGCHESDAATLKDKVERHRNEEKVMEKVRLGKTNMMVSKLGLGGLQLQTVSEGEAIAIVKRCLELGITFIDTADMYLNNEVPIGKAISGQQDRVILATKLFHPDCPSRTRKDVAGTLEGSLKQLGVESIDLYQFHLVKDFDTLEMILAPDGAVAGVEDAKRRGLVKHIGITSHQIDVAKEAVKSGRFETIQFPLNFVCSEAAEELLPLAREQDVGFIAMKALAGGVIQNVNIAFKYLFQFQDVVVIPGVKSTHEMEEILQVVEGPLSMTEAEKVEMQKLRQELWTKICRRCDYCQPCPEEIPIGYVMSTDIIAARMPPDQLFFGAFADAMEKAPNCTKCGLCEERCPYGLPIMEVLEKNTEWYQAKKSISSTLK